MKRDTADLGFSAFAEAASFGACEMPAALSQPKSWKQPLSKALGALAQNVLLRIMSAQKKPVKPAIWRRKVNGRTSSALPTVVPQILRSPWRLLASIVKIGLRTCYAKEQNSTEFKLVVKRAVLSDREGVRFQDKSVVRQERHFFAHDCTVFPECSLV